MLRCAVRRFSLSLLFTLACLSLGARGAQATTIIDAFNDGSVNIPGPAANFLQAGLTDVLDGTRVDDVSNSAGTLNIDLAFADKLRFTTTSASIAMMTYPTPNTNFFDLMEGGSTGFFELEVVNVSDANDFAISVTVLDDDGGSDSQSFAFSGIGTLILDFSDFTGVNFAEVQQVQLTLASSTDGFIKLGEFSAVPEPSTAALMGLGLLGLAITGQRRAA